MKNEMNTPIPEWFLTLVNCATLHMMEKEKDNGNPTTEEIKTT